MRTDQAPNQIRKTAAVAAGGSVGDISVYAKSTTLLLLTLAIFFIAPAVNNFGCLAKKNLFLQTEAKSAR